MDPNETIRRIRLLAGRLLEDGTDSTHPGQALAELVQALDGWITRGGFLPDDWQPLPGPDVSMARLEVELDSPNGPRVIVYGHTRDEVLAALPAGYTIHTDDWCNGVQLAGGAWSYPLSAAEDARYPGWPTCACGRPAVDGRTTCSGGAFRVWRFDSETDGSLQTCLGAFATLDEAMAHARRNGGHQVQAGDDGEVTNLQSGRR